MALAFSPDALKQIDAIRGRYPTAQAACLPVLHLAQDEFGHISDEAIDAVAGALGLPPAHVWGVVTFYTMYHQHPVGKYFVQVCTTSPCGICGAEDVVKSFLQHTKAGELGLTSPDNRFTVIEVECLGACGFPTPVMINEQFIESVTPETVPDILAKLP
jgi:NADH:ubiquinone oxidoreductase subunit E